MNKELMRKELQGRTENEIFEFLSPARINLIGEHIDYVGGLVVPAAIDLAISAYATKSENIEIKSMNFGQDWSVEDNFSYDIKYNESNSFMNFVYGALIELKKATGDKLNEKSGFKLILNSTIPVASGLSSSAAFGMLIMEVMDSFYNLGLSKIEKALIFQKVENNFIGVKSGIMDQFAIGLGKKDKFIKLNTATLDYEYVSAGLEDYRFILISTNRARKLTDSGYNQRVEELTEVSKILGMEFMTLSKANDEDLNKITDPILNKRLKHVISEVKRVNLISEGLKTMKGKELGLILNQAHNSLSKDYEVSCDESDFINEELNKNDKVFGSRMIGAGFGGCMLAVVTKDFDIKSINFNQEYHNKFGINFDVYEFKIEDGVKEL